MRTNHILSNLKFALVFAPILSCGGSGGGDPVIPTGGLTLPDCTDGQILGTDNTGTPFCKSAPTAQLDIPSCANAQALTTTDGKVLSCKDLPMGGTDAATATAITKAENDVMDLRTKVDALKAGAGGGGALFVGVTPAKYKGRWEHGTNNPGIESANALCADTYGTGAQICTPVDLYGSVVAGKFKYDGTGNVPKAWVFAPNQHAPGSSIAAPVNPTEGYSDTCADGLYNTHDQGWSGVVFEWTVVRTGNYGPKFHNGKTIDCNLDFPIACCK